ncbi:putative membrane protein [Campylobacter ornithocola]|nr:putative membrane protein [Campylobacter ornithocola]
MGGGYGEIEIYERWGFESVLVFSYNFIIYFFKGIIVSFLWVLFQENKLKIILFLLFSIFTSMLGVLVFKAKN